MSHIIQPKEKILTPGEYHCCKTELGGRTPTEYDAQEPISVTEATTHNGDGTFTKT